MQSILEEKGTRRCYACGIYATQGYMHEHHIFGGANRKKSEKYGLKVHLCYVCHEDNVKGVHGANRELKEKLHRDGQQAYEARHGSRQQFMDEFGKNYL